ncbi:hypothetical protein [Azotobacter beijerinckii]|uniref:hypothetical protein n=1 Tax=Azotobacter beijerinckii TaxID=170623 RepID=UPI002953DD1E|nr:hypothetical protein [Azotobacter beijerinckii]MDV7213029.1 hypothetical protein [Azotobacter beijerinckii]
MDASAAKVLKVRFKHQRRHFEATVTFAGTVATVVLSTLPHYPFTIDLDAPEDVTLTLPSDREGAKPVICGSLDNVPFLAEALNAARTALWLAPKAPPHDV